MTDATHTVEIDEQRLKLADSVERLRELARIHRVCPIGLPHCERCVEQSIEIDALISRGIVLALLDEIAAMRKRLDDAKGRAGWLAQLVIDKLGGTNDLDAWVKRSANYYAEALARAADAERERDEAYERAAKVADEYPLTCRGCGEDIAHRIRALAKGEK